VRDVKAIGERPDGSRFTFIPYPTPIKDETGNLIGGINMLVEQHDPLAAAASDLTRQIQTLSLLHELSAFLADCIDTDESLAKILETLTELHGTRFGLIMLYDSAKNVLYEVASRGFEEDNAFTVTPGSSAGGSGTCFWSKTRVIIEDTEVDLRFENHREAARKIGVRAVHSTPVLMRDGSIAGTISVYLDIPRQPDRREMQAADMCARYIAQVLRSSQLKQE